MKHANNSYYVKRNCMIVAIVFAIVAALGLSAVGFSAITTGDQFAHAVETPDAISTIYQYNAQLQVGQDQKVAVEFNDEANCDENSKVVYRRAVSNFGSPNQLVLDCEATSGDMALYSATIPDNSYIGAYVLEKIVFGDGHEYKTTIDDDTNFLGQFEISEAVDGDFEMAAGIYNINDDGTLTQTTNGDGLTNQMLMTEAAVQAKNAGGFNGSIKVALDPGHGGSDSGATSGGLLEKNLNWTIAQACAQELTYYDGASSYITRGENECPGLQERVDRARANSCNIFVSLHNNSGGGTGSEVWVQHGGGWQSDLCNGTGVNIGNRVLQKICDRFGLANRGVKERYCTDGSTYPDGSQGDYYSVLYHARNSTNYVLPAMIIEHAFLGADDGLLANESNLREMGALDADAICEAYGLTKGASGGENIIGTYNIEMAASSTAVMDVKGASTAEKANVEVGTKSSNNSQKWRVVTDAAGWAVLFNVNSGLVLTADGPAVERTNVVQATFADTDAQKWSFHKRSDGSYYIQSRLGNHQVLDVDNGVTTAGTNIKLYTENGNIAQSFRLTKVEQPEQGERVNGTYYIKYAKNKNYVVDVDNASKDDGANIQLYSANQSEAQQFIITTNVDGYAYITNKNSMKQVDVSNGWTYAKTNIQQYTYNKSDAQQWKIVKNSDGTYSFLSKVNENIAMDVAGGVAADKQNIWTYYATFAESQRFELVDAYPELEPSTADIELDNYQIAPSDKTTFGIGPVNNSLDEGSNAELTPFSLDVNSQVYTIAWYSDYYYIININTGLALDSGGEMTKYGQKVVHKPIEFGDITQMWAAYSQPDGTIMFKSRGNKMTLCAATTVTEGTMVVTSNNTNALNTWKVGEPEYKAIDLDGVFYISSALDYNKVIDVEGGSTDNGANVQIYDLNKSNAQRWAITTDYYKIATIKNVGSGKALDIAGGTYVSGTNVWQYEANDTYAQKWLICEQNGHYVIRNLLNPTICLDLAGGNTDNGSNIQVYQGNGTVAQQFDFINVYPQVPESTLNIPYGKYSIQSNLSSTRGVNVAGGSHATGANINLATLHDNTASCAFYIQKVDGYYQIINAGSGKAIGLDGYNVCLRDVNSQDRDQLWSAQNNSGSITFLNAGTGFALNVENGKDVEGANIGLSVEKTSDAQRWTLNVLHSPIGEKINGTFYISSLKNWTTVIDVAGGSTDSGANVQVYGANYSGAQKWKVTTDDNGIATITNAQSGKVLDIAGGDIQSGTNVWQYESNGSNAQKFKFVADGDSYRIYSAYNDYVCIDLCGGNISNCTNVQIWDANGSDAQAFNLTDVDPIPPISGQVDIADKTYKISPVADSNFAIDIDGGRSDNGTNIQLYQYNQSGAQIFRITKEGNYYKFINAMNGKCLDVDGGHVLPGTNVQLWDNTSGNPNQLWAAYDAGNGAVYFQNIASGIMLDLAGGTCANHQNIHVYKPNLSDAQKWVLTEAQYIPPVTGHPIMRGATTYVQQMINRWNSVGKSYPSDVYASRGAANMETWIQICYEEATAEGVDPAVLFCQAMHETGWLQFGGQVHPEQCNFGGLGATDGGSQGASFPDVRTGLRAQVQHLKAYACTADLVNPCVDPRFHLVTRGCAPCVEDLGGKWATDRGYGERLVAAMNELYKY